MHVLVVDDHPVFLGALESILGGYFEGMAFKGMKSLEEMSRVKPTDFSLVIIDLSFRGKDNTRDVCALIERNQKAKFLILTNFEDGRHVRMVAEAGAHGYLPKSTPAEILTSVVQLVMAGGRYFPQDLGQDQANTTSALPGAATNDGTEGSGKPLLTERQMDIFEKLAGGSTISELAIVLRVSEPTIKADIAKATRAVDARNRLHAVCRALEMGLIHPELT